MVSIMIFTLHVKENMDVKHLEIFSPIHFFLENNRNKTRKPRKKRVLKTCKSSEKKNPSKIYTYILMLGHLRKNFKK